MMIAQNLSKKVKRQQILEQINWKLGKGVYALIGPNGSGKSTLLKILAGVLAPSSGDVQIDEYKLSARPDDYRKKIGYLPQCFSGHDEWTVHGLMKQAAIFKGLYKRQPRSAQIKKRLEEVDLWENRQKKLKALTPSMMQRLGLAQALLNDPQYLLLDEPTTHLNPEEKHYFYKLICRYGKSHTVILSSHITHDLIDCCRHVAVIQSGCFLFVGTPKELAFVSTKGNEPHGSLLHYPKIGRRSRSMDVNALSPAFVDGYRLIVGGKLND